MQLNAKKFALAAGIFWGATMFLFTFLAIATGYPSEFLDFMAYIYPGYTVSFGGSFVGLIYGFFDGFVCFWIFATLYNRLLR